MTISPETLQEIIYLANELRGLFSPPELVVGCEVKDITDKNLYATNNGWIEAVVGRHNQQRCRWRGLTDIQVGDYVDVLYFASYRLFSVFGPGGTAAPTLLLPDHPHDGAANSGGIVNRLGPLPQFEVDDSGVAIIRVKNSQTFRVYNEAGQYLLQIDELGNCEYRPQADNTNIIFNAAGYKVRTEFYTPRGVAILADGLNDRAQLGYDDGAYVQADDDLLTHFATTLHGFADGITKTVRASGGDFTTVQAAIEWFVGKKCRSCVIDVEAGTYNESLDLDGIEAATDGGLEIRGDTRGLAGVSFVDDAPIKSQDANAGSGIVSLSNPDGVSIQVTGSVSSPNFFADGWCCAGDKVIVLDNSGTLSELTISDASGNVISFTSAAPAVGNKGTSITLKPNRVINAGGATGINVGQSQGVKIVGLHFEHTGGNIGILSSAGGRITGNNCSVKGDGSSGSFGLNSQNRSYISLSDSSLLNTDFGARASSLAAIGADRCYIIGSSNFALDAFSYGQISAGNSVAANCNTGFVGRISGQIFCQDSYAIKITNYGFYAADGGVVYGSTGTPAGTVADTCARGYFANNQSVISAFNCAARNNSFGYYSQRNSVIVASGTNANNSGNGANYSPAASDAPGNVDAIIQWS